MELAFVRNRDRPLPDRFSASMSPPGRVTSSNRRRERRGGFQYTRLCSSPEEQGLRRICAETFEFVARKGDYTVGVDILRGSGEQLFHRASISVRVDIDPGLPDMAA